MNDPYWSTMFNDTALQELDFLRTCFSLTPQHSTTGRDSTTASCCGRGGTGETQAPSRIKRLISRSVWKPVYQCLSASPNWTAILGFYPTFDRPKEWSLLPKNDLAVLCLGGILCFGIFCKEWFLSMFFQFIMFIVSLIWPWYNVQLYVSCMLAAAHPWLGGWLVLVMPHFQTHLHAEAHFGIEIFKLRSGENCGPSMGLGQSWKWLNYGTILYGLPAWKVSIPQSASQNQKEWYVWWLYKVETKLHCSDITQESRVFVFQRN